MNAAKTSEVEKTLVGGSSHRSSSGSVANMEDRSYKHARVTIGGGARVQQQQDAATNQLWKYAGILWTLTLFVLFYGFWPSRKSGGRTRRKAGHIRP